MNNSHLYDEKTFYSEFIRDLSRCQKEVIIESPYITTNRTQIFYPVFRKLVSKGVKIYVVTKAWDDLEEHLRSQSRIEVRKFETIGVQPLLCIGNHHRKLAILDRKILWEGSLNIRIYFRA